MKKKVSITALTGLMALTGVCNAVPIYASENINLNSFVDDGQHKAAKIVYLASGGGTGGSGTESNPYKDIRTALSKINDGEVLRIVGNVSFTDFDTDPVDKATLPLFINKRIIIEGVDENNDCLTLRAPIQLGADVTFRNMRLQVGSQVSLGGENTDGQVSGSLGQIVPRANTIFAAGHKLTLDNVNTKLGSNPDQNDDRPYISGGVFRNRSENMGDKAIINVINPNSQTRISAIYAGDYWTNRKMDVEINLEGELVDKNIYAGGYEKTLEGTVDINLYNASNAVDINRENHTGDVNVTLKSGFDSTILSLSNIDDLTLENNTRLLIPSTGTFNVRNVNLPQGSKIDFSKMTTNPIVRNNFNGVESDDLNKCGIIILNNDYSLNIEGNVFGTTRLNSGVIEYLPKFKENHQYIIAKGNASGDFSVEGSKYPDFSLEKKVNGSETVWTAINTKEKKVFKDFKWMGGNTKLINAPQGEYFSYPIEFIDIKGNPYTLELSDLDDFRFEITKPNGEKTDIDNLDDMDLDFYWDYEECELLLSICDSNNFTGIIKMTATHLSSGKTIERYINVFNDSGSGKLRGEVKIEGSPNIGGTIYADTFEVLADDSILKYTWYVDGNEVSGEEGRELNITEDHIGEVTVKVTSENHTEFLLSDKVIVEKPVDPTTPDENPDTSEPDDDTQIPDGDNSGDSGDKDEEETPSPSEPGEDDDNETPDSGGSDEDDKEETDTEKPDEDKPVEGNPDKDENQGEPGNDNEEDPDKDESGGDNKPDDEPSDEVVVDNKKKLKEFYNKCIKAGYDKNDYTRSSFDTYQKALKNAENIINDENAEKFQIETALSKLQKAVDGLKEKPSGGSGGGGGGSSSGSTENKNDKNEEQESQAGENTADKVDTVINANVNNNIPVQPEKPNWNLKDGKWKVILADGSVAKGWYKDENSNKWYMLDRENGDMITGWYKDSDNKWYMLNRENGDMITGWHKDLDNKWYYLDSASGSMVTGWFKDSNGKWYNLSQSGAMNTGWYKDTDGRWYYLYEDGSMAVNTTIDGYQLGSDGSWIR